MLERYYSLTDTRPGPSGLHKWSGNNRWYAAEQPAPLDYIFATAPISEEDGDIDGEEHETATANHIGRRTLFRLTHINPPPLTEYTYRADGLSASATSITYHQIFPWDHYGVLMQWEGASPTQPLALQIEHAQACGRLNQATEPVRLTLHKDGMGWELVDGPYTLVSRCTGCTIAQTETGFLLHIQEPQARISITFHLDARHAHQEAQNLLEQYEMYLQVSASFWESYLQSCPLYQPDENIRCVDPVSGQEIILDTTTVQTRQLWHWWAALVNVADVDFQPGTPYLAPDRNLWFGSWSNDSPEALCALTLTNQHTLARRCIVRYIQQAINVQGDLSWYTHSYGRASLGHTQDSGLLSHGVPTIVHTVEFYTRHTGDVSLLQENAGDDLTVWEKLKHYIQRVFSVRDPNQDGLIEWVNLWETGWDNKTGPFFASAPLDTWVEVICRGNMDEIRAWYAEHARPVTTIGEQVHFLTALESMQRLAHLQQDHALARICQERIQHIRLVVEQRHWNSATEFYQDWDVSRQTLCDAKNLDAFYYLYFSEDHERAAKIVAQRSHKKTFGLRYPPTLSADHPLFDPAGYWLGSYWPREMLYVGLALHKQGYHELALHEVLMALCSQEGCVIAEHLDPLTGQRLGTCMTMAYSACLNIVLQEIITGRPLWL